MPDLLGVLKKPNPPLAQGRRVTLRYLSRGDLKKLRGWFNDAEVVSLAFGVQAEKDVLQRIADDYYRELFWWQRNVLALEVGDRDLIGFIKYTVREDRGTVAKVGIMIGERRYWSDGYGTEAMDLLLHYLFDDLKVDRIELDTAEFNLRAQRCFEKVGFTRMGNFTEINFLDGRAVPKVWMALESAAWRLNRTAAISS